MKTIEELKRSALARGVSLEINGKIFNASRRKVKVAKKPKEKPAVTARLIQPPPVSAPVAPKEDKVLKCIEEFAANTFHLSEVNTKLLGHIQSQLDNIPPAAVPVRKWIFNISYDERTNKMTSIEAIAKA